MKMVVANFRRALFQPGDIKARTRLCWASTIAMSQFARLVGGGGTLTCHGIEHVLSGCYDITHGDGPAALMPAWMEYTYPVMEARFELLGKSGFGRKDEIQATEEWLESVGMRLRAHPRPLDVPAIARIYRESF